MDSVINDRRSLKWPCYAVNSSRNGRHSHSKRDIRHEVKLEKNLEQPSPENIRFSKLFVAGDVSHSFSVVVLIIGAVEF